MREDTNRVRLAGATALALALVAGLLATSAFAAASRPPLAARGIGIQLVTSPAAPPLDPLARIYITGQFAPGATSSRQVAITNTTRQAQTVSLYSAAASMHGGVFAFAANRTQNELSGWTSVSHPVLRLSAGATAVETVTIRVPTRASAGERYSVVWAAVTAPSARAGGVKLVNRVGVRIYLSVGSGGAPPVSFVLGMPRATRSGTGRPLVVASVRNDGEGTIALSGSLLLSRGPGGLRAGPFPLRLARALAPHRSRRITLLLNTQLPRGPWHVQITLTGGTTHRSSSARITFPELGARS
jgi:hypothetical protein